MIDNRLQLFLEKELLSKKDKRIVFKEPELKDLSIAELQEAIKTGILK